jgi:hypothetical protein
MWLAMGWMSKLHLIPDSALTTTVSRQGLGFTEFPIKAVATIKQPNCETCHTITLCFHSTIFNYAEGQLD